MEIWFVKSYSPAFSPGRLFGSRQGFVDSAKSINLFGVYEKCLDGRKNMGRWVALFFLRRTVTFSGFIKRPGQSI